MQKLELWMKTIADLEILLPRTARTIATFYNENTRCFSGIKKDSTSAISTARCVEVGARLPLTSDSGDLAEDRRRQLIWFTEHGRKWSSGKSDEQAYPISVVLPAVHLLNAYVKDPGLQAKAQEAIREKIPTVAQWVNQLQSDPAGNKPEHHAMFLYRVSRTVNKARLKPWELKLDSEWGLLNLYIQGRFHSHMSMCTAIPGNEEDALQLGYLCYALRRYFEFQNEVLLEHAIELVFATLGSRGLRPRNYRIEGDVSASGLELFTLLSRMDHVRRRFDRYSRAYAAAYRWLRATERLDREAASAEEESDTPMWRDEPWRGRDKPEAWLNAMVIDFLVSYRDLLRDVVSAELMARFRATTQPPSITWEQISIPTTDKPKEFLEQCLIEPAAKLFGGGAGAPWRSARLPKSSVILFGPPGTAKTSVARAIAAKLRWPFVSLSPHHFAEEGLQGVIRKSRQVFEQVMLMRRCVVLFDEIEALVADREAQPELIGRFISASVLPWFQGLRDRAEVIFVVATNHIGLFDSAIKRPGRFDVVLPVGPPGEAERASLIERLLAQRWRELEDNPLDIKSSTVAGWLSAKINAEVMTVSYKGAVAPTVPFPLTIGEIIALCDLVVLGFAKPFPANVSEAEDRASDAVRRVLQRPLISQETYGKFLRDARLYTFPPALRLHQEIAATAEAAANAS